MPAAYVAKVARETGRSVAELEAHWKAAEAKVRKQYGTTDGHFGVVTTIFKNMAHHKESVEPIREATSDEVVASMKRADAKGHRGPRSEDHYSWVHQHKDWTLTHLHPHHIHALAADEDLPAKIKSEYHEPAVVTAAHKGAIVAQDGNHRVVAAQQRGDKSVAAYVPTAHLHNLPQHESVSTMPTPLAMAEPVANVHDGDVHPSATDTPRPEDAQPVDAEGLRKRRDAEWRRSVLGKHESATNRREGTMRKDVDEKAKLGGGKRFAAIKAKAAREPGVRDPAAVAAAAGIKAHGKNRMERLARAGKARAEESATAGTPEYHAHESGYHVAMHAHHDAMATKLADEHHEQLPHLTKAAHHKAQNLKHVEAHNKLTYGKGQGISPVALRARPEFAAGQKKAQAELGKAESVAEDMMSGDLQTGVTDDTHMVVAGSPGMSAQDLKLQPNDVQHYKAWTGMKAAKDTKYKKPVYTGKLHGADGDHHVFDMGNGAFHAFPVAHVKAHKKESTDMAANEDTSASQTAVLALTAAQAAANGSPEVMPQDVVAAPVDSGHRKPPTVDYDDAAGIAAAIHAAGIPCVPEGGQAPAGCEHACRVTKGQDGIVHWRWVDLDNDADRNAPRNRTEGEVRVAACLGGLRLRTVETRPGSGDWIVSAEPFQDYRAADAGGLDRAKDDETEDRSNQGPEAADLPGDPMGSVMPPLVQPESVQLTPAQRLARRLVDSLRRGGA